MKQFITIALILFSGVLFAQKNLSSDNSDNLNSKTTVQRKVILENFTTASCPNCPPIHVLLENYMTNHPNAIIIAQHAGYYTDIFTIPENTELLALYNAGGSTYAPALAIDRHHYSTGLTGGSPDPGPVFWPGESSSATITRIDDRLNLPANVTLNIAYTYTSGVLDLDISGELTENVTGSDLRLVVYIIEDGLIANQSGGGSNYTHNNVMRDAISETWGDSGVITSNTSGTTFAKQYSYTLDSSWILDNLSVVAFVANYDNGDVNNREILQAQKKSLKSPVGTNNVAILGVNDIPSTCDMLISPSLIVKNYGSANITSLTIDYSINSGNTTGTYNWSGDPIALYDQAEIILEDISFTELNATNSIDFEITHVNGVTDDDSSNNTANSSFDTATTAVDHNIQVFIQTGNNGNECTWEIADSNGAVVESGGPYGNNENINEFYSFPEDCYTFTVYDSGGNGGETIIVADANSNPLYYSSGNHGAEEAQEFSVPLSLDIDNLAFTESSIYPNPANSELNIKNAEGLNINIFDILGRKLLFKENISIEEQINISDFAEGTYLLTLSDGNKIRTEKIIITR